MLFRKTLHFIILGFIFYSCEKTPNEWVNSEGTFEMVVRNVAGDDYTYGHKDSLQQFMSYPFHMGYVRGFKSAPVQCVLLSKSVSPRSRILAKPIGLLTTMERGQRIRYVIAIPSHKRIKSIQIENFSDLVTKYSSVKNIIEFWLFNRCGLACVRNEGWQDERAAETVLENLK